MNLNTNQVPTDFSSYPSNWQWIEMLPSDKEHHELFPTSHPKNPWMPLLRFYSTHYPPGFHRKVIAEVIATYLLVFVTCGSAAISASDHTQVPKLGASIAGGLIVTVMIYAVGHISGAHMNPAVTLSFAAVPRFPWKQAPCYVAAQLIRAISAGFTLQVLLDPILRLCTTSPSGSPFQALTMEMVVTFSMMFLTSAVATYTKAIRELAGIAVGSAVCITSIFAELISGGSMNLARTIGPAVASSYYKDLRVYIMGPATGTLLGAWSYSIIRDSGNKPVNEVSPTTSLKLRRTTSGDNDDETHAF